MGEAASRTGEARPCPGELAGFSGGGAQRAPGACRFWGVSSRGAMAAPASSLIRQKREVREPGGSRPVSAQRRVCPRGTKSLCQKQLLILLSKVRLCGGRPARPDRCPGEWLGRGLRAGGLSAWEVEARDSEERGPTDGGSPKVKGGAPGPQALGQTMPQFPFSLAHNPESPCFRGQGEGLRG